jgi:LacI family transcriptional regulator
MSAPARATVADVARLASVSAKTVSRVFLEEAKVAPATRERVLDAAKRLRFRPNTVARDLRRGGVTNTVAFVMGDIHNPFYFAVAAGVERELADHGYTMLFATTDDAPDTERLVVDVLLSQRVRALLLVPVADDQSYLEGERHLGTPIIGVDRPAGDLIADSVVLANRSGMADAVRSLLADGHRRIGFVANPSSIYTVRERFDGYRQALSEAGIGAHPEWERLSDDPSTTTRAAVESLLSLPEPPTALVTGNNRATAGALQALRDRPAQISLIGFDDFEFAEMLGVSVVSYDAHELGRQAARLAIDRIADPAGLARAVEIPTRLILRDSSRVSPVA